MSLTSTRCCPPLTAPVTPEQARDLLARLWQAQAAERALEAQVAAHPESWQAHASQRELVYRERLAARAALDAAAEALALTVAGLA